MARTEKIDTRHSDVIDLALDTIAKNKQALVFVNNKKSAEKCAEDIASKIQNMEKAELSDSIIAAIPRPTKQCERLARTIRKGVAFHHAGLTQKQREIIEDEFRRGEVSIICCTPTLAAGVDLPAYRAIIRDLKRFSDTGWGGMQYIPVLEYLQMAGRAGRPKFDTSGEAIIIAQNDDEREKLYNKYILGEPEDIYSKLAVEPVLRTYLLSLISSEFVHTKKEIMDFFSKTFWAYQFRDMDKLEEIIDRMLDLLERYEFIISKKDTFESADEIDKVRATLLGKRVAQLYIDPLTAHHLIKCIRRSTGKVITAFGLLQMVSNTLEMRPLLKVRTAEFERFNQAYISHEGELLQKEPSIYEMEYDDFINSVKTSLFLQDWIDEKDEEFLYEEYDVRPGETRAKLDKGDWLLYSAEELAKLMSFHDIIKHIAKLRFRMLYGVKEELLPLLRLSGIGRVRARKLYTAGIKDLGDVKSADITTLSQLIGKAIALDIKKQVGQDLDKMVVPENKRKGQISLNDWGG